MRVLGAGIGSLKTPPALTLTHIRVIRKLEFSKITECTGNSHEIFRSSKRMIPLRLGRKKPPNFRNQCMSGTRDEISPDSDDEIHEVMTAKTFQTWQQILNRCTAGNSRILVGKPFVLRWRIVEASVMCLNY